MDLVQTGHMNEERFEDDCLSFNTCDDHCVAVGATASALAFMGGAVAAALLIQSVHRAMAHLTRRNPHHS